MGEGGLVTQQWTLSAGRFRSSARASPQMKVTVGVTSLGIPLDRSSFFWGSFYTGIFPCWEERFTAEAKECGAEEDVDARVRHGGQIEAQAECPAVAGPPTEVKASRAPGESAVERGIFPLWWWEGSAGFRCPGLTARQRKVNGAKSEPGFIGQARDSIAWGALKTKAEHQLAGMEISIAIQRADLDEAAAAEVLNDVAESHGHELFFQGSIWKVFSHSMSLS